MSVAELLAEVEESPRGPGVGAFFDFDGTLIYGYSALALTRERLRRGELTADEIVRSAQTLFAYSRGRADFGDFIGLLAESWKDRRDDDLHALGERLFVRRLAARVYPEARALVKAHQRRGHRVVLASSATSYQVAPLARDLGVNDVICTRFEVLRGRLTGRPVLPHLWGEGKQRAVEEFAWEHGVELGRSFAYADGNEDAKLLERVGNPRPTNPNRELAEIAERRGWPQHRFTSRGPVTLPLVARNLIAAGSFLGTLAFAAGLALANQDKNVILNTVGSVASDLVLATLGVRLVVSGSGHLWSQRPAIFIFNHQSGVDPLIAMNLIRRDYTGVGKRELARDPISKRIAKWSDAVLIDRSNNQASVAALKELLRDVAAKGKSILIAPEGTRSPTPTLGPFKKGAFRMAMDSGMPLVPIVIRNAHDVLPKTSLLLRPAVVDVAVLPPISTGDWTLGELDKRIAEVRQAFLDTLAHWPAERHEARAV